MPASTAPISAFRLRFIDMARAVAILLMLEGHFVDMTLAAEWRVAGHPVFETWNYIRGMTAPMFFTVTGLIFSYLLSGAPEPGFWKVKRVRRGLLRALELLVWGYLLQVNLGNFSELLRGEWDHWLQAFHVLQCIAVGLVTMMVIFGLFRRAGPWVLAAAYGAAALFIFLLAVVLANQTGWLPKDAPEWVQNSLKGPYSSFPVAPWLGFTFYGAALGVLVRHRAGLGEGAVSAVGFLAIGVALRLVGWALDPYLGHLALALAGHTGPPAELRWMLHGRVGEILIVLGVLVWIENRYRPGASWFQTIGRNTFPIYVAHVVVLYGGIFGIGLDSGFEKSLNPWQAALGALVFCGFFGYAAQWVEPLTLRWRALREEWKER
jgi:uncharacterized membrane protein